MRGPIVMLLLCSLSLAFAFRVPLQQHQRTRIAMPRMCATPEGASGEVPAADDTPAPEPEVAPAESKGSGYSAPTDFLGLDVSSPLGALGATAIVSVGFVTVVEALKAIDPVDRI